jgi:hypothetical protein
VHDREQAAGSAETDSDLTLLTIAGAIPKHEERVLEDGDGFLECNCMFAPVLGGLALVPSKGRATAHELTVHLTASYPSVFTM